MSKVRVCGKVCHKAKGSTCKCWCGGLFHGSKGNAAREAFASEWGGDPKGDHSERGGDRWQTAMAKAHAAREPQKVAS